MDKLMKLPEEKTCSDCIFCKKCCSMFGAEERNISCDFYPVKFIEKNEQAKQN